MYLEDPHRFDGAAIDKEYLAIIGKRVEYRDAVGSGNWQSSWPTLPLRYSIDAEESPRTTHGRAWAHALTEDTKVGGVLKIASSHYYATRPEAAGEPRETLPHVYPRLFSVRERMLAGEGIDLTLAYTRGTEVY